MVHGYYIDCVAPDYPRRTNENTEGCCSPVQAATSAIAGASAKANASIVHPARPGGTAARTTPRRSVTVKLSRFSNGYQLNFCNDSRLYLNLYRVFRPRIRFRKKSAGHPPEGSESGPVELRRASKALGWPARGPAKCRGVRIQ